MNAAPQIAGPAASSRIALPDVLARGDVWRGGALARPPQAGEGSGHPGLDAELPGGGWPRGELAELLAERPGIGELSLLLPALARLSAAGGWLALVAPPFVPHAPAWRAAGISPGRLLVVEDTAHAPWAAEQLIGCGGFAAVLAWLERPDSRALRRLQLAVDGKRTLAFLCRPAKELEQPSPAPLRLLLAADPAGVAVRVAKRRGPPMAGWRTVPVFRPGRAAGRPEQIEHALAGAPLPAAAARRAGLSLVA